MLVDHGSYVEDLDATTVATYDEHGNCTGGYYIQYIPKDLLDKLREQNSQDLERGKK